MPPEELKAQLRKQVGRLGHACEAECRRQGAGKPQGADALGMYELKRLCREHLPLIEPRAVPTCCATSSATRSATRAPTSLCGC